MNLNPSVSNPVNQTGVESKKKSTEIPYFSDSADNLLNARIVELYSQTSRSR